MDPSYEVVEDYEKALATLTGAAARWPTGIYMLWYPVLSRQRDSSRLMLHRLKSSGLPNLMLAELRIREQQEEFGMCGSVLAIVNAPWQFDKQLRSLLPKLKGALAEDGAASWKVEWLIKSE
jgi:23S rRNA (adenine2030-N6)-methyltransferase